MSDQLRINSDRLAQVARVAGESVKKGYVPSAVVAVADSRETLWTHVTPGEDNVRLDSIFLLASITKPVVATAIMRLVEEGKLSLTVPISHYLPDFGGGGKEEITAWHILNHSSGMEEDKYWAEMDELGRQGQLVPRSHQYDGCRRSELNFAPGTAHRYTTLTFSVLAELITRLGGKEYTEYMQEDMFEPLGMKSTAFHPIDSDRRVPVHGFGPPELLEGFITLAQPGGGLWSTASDLVAFGQAYLRGGRMGDYHLLSPVTIDYMTQHYTQGKTQMENGQEKPFNYALGWGKPSSMSPYESMASDRAYGHSGATGTMLWIDPEYDLVYVFLTNQWSISDVSDTKGRILNAVYGAFERS